MQRHAIGGRNLPTKLGKPQVVTHVGVGDQNPVHQRSRDRAIGKSRLKKRYLLLDGWGGFNKMQGASLMIHHSQSRRQFTTALRTRLHTAGLATAQLRHAAILGPAQDHNLDRSTSPTTWPAISVPNRQLMSGTRMNA